MNADLVRSQVGDPALAASGTHCIRPARQVRLVAALGAAVMLPVSLTAPFVLFFLAVPLVYVALRLQFAMSVRIDSRELVVTSLVGRRRIPVEDVLCALYVPPRRVDLRARVTPKHSSLSVVLSEPFYEPIRMAIYESPYNNPRQFADAINEQLGVTPGEQMIARIQHAKRLSDQHQFSLGRYIRAAGGLATLAAIGGQLVFDPEASKWLRFGLAPVVIAIAALHTRRLVTKMRSIVDWKASGAEASMREYVEVN